MQIGGEREFVVVNERKKGWEKNPVAMVAVFYPAARGGLV